MSLQQVKEIAKKVRKAFEEIEENEGGGPFGLIGYCGRASIQLYYACRRAGLNDIELWDGDGHTFNVYRDTIVDITATQFGHRSKVYTCKFNDREKRMRECEYITDGKDEGRCFVPSKNWAYDHRVVRRDSSIVKKHLGF